MLALAPFLVFMGILEWIVFFQDLDHFFQGDTVFWLYHRAPSWIEFFKGFLSLDPGGWYRPLGNRLLPSLFFPVFGMHPTGYRVVVFALFFLITGAVLMLLFQLTQSKIAACAGTLFFGMHTVNAFTTYDAAFAPELLFGLFYVSSVIAFLRYRQTNRNFSLIISILCLTLSLFSKEAAVSLPFTLVALGLFIDDSHTIGKKIIGTIRATCWHFLVLFAYLVFVAGYLGVAGITASSVLATSTKANAPVYSIVPDRGLFMNLDYALTWAFNIPRGWITESRHLPQWCVEFLKIFRFAFVGLVFVGLFFKRHRAWLLFGIAWFLIAVSPALPWRNHFLPYYLFVPIIGLSIVFAAVAGWMEEHSKGFGIARWGLFLPLSVLLTVCVIGIHNDVRQNPLLGRSSQLALNTLTDVNKLYPTLEPGTTLYIINDTEPDLAWDHSLGDLFRLHYHQRSLQALYSSKGAIMPANADSLIVLQYENGHLIKVGK